jgi:hypothetical protein
MFCPKCGNENPDTNQFCGKCGTTLPSQASSLQTPPPLKNKGMGYVWVLIIIILLIAIWCMLISPYNPTQLKYSSDLHIGEATGINGFNSLTIKFQIYNSGNAKATNVQATVKILDVNNKILASKGVYVGNIDPGDSKTITTSIQGTFPQSSKYQIIPSAS